MKRLLVFLILTLPCTAEIHFSVSSEKAKEGDYVGLAWSIEGKHGACNLHWSTGKAADYLYIQPYGNMSWQVWKNTSFKIVCDKGSSKTISVSVKR